MCVGVFGELRGDPLLEGLDVGDDCGQRGDERAGHRCGGAGRAGRAPCCGDEASVQDGRVLAAGVVRLPQPCGQPDGVSRSVSSWLVNRARNRRLVMLSSSANSLTGPGWKDSRCSRSWLASPTRWVSRSLRARTVERSCTVAGVSGISGRSRARSVRRVSARTNASNRSSLFRAEP